MLVFALMCVVAYLLAVSTFAAVVHDASAPVPRGAELGFMNDSSFRCRLLLCHVPIALHV